MSTSQKLLPKKTKKNNPKDLLPKSYSIYFKFNFRKEYQYG